MFWHGKMKLAGRIPVGAAIVAFALGAVLRFGLLAETFGELISLRRLLLATVVVAAAVAANEFGSGSSCFSIRFDFDLS